MSMGVLAQVGVGVTAAAAGPNAGGLASAAQSGLGLLFLKNGRDDERQADRLGVRYCLRESIDPNSMVSVFETLGRVSAQASSERMPGWLSTHPAPENRRELIRAEIDSYGEAATGELRIERDSYLARLDGLVYGKDPREGYFKQGLFIQPELRFQLRFPEGWKTFNSTEAVAAISPDEDAIVRLSLAQAESAEAAATAFFESEEIERGSSRRSPGGGLVGLSYRFRVPRDEGALSGIAAFIEHRDSIYQIIGYTAADAYQRYGRTLGAVEASFQTVTDRALLDVEPLRLARKRLSRATTLEAWVESQGSPVSAERLGLLNNVDENETIAAGEWIKIVEGELP